MEAIIIIIVVSGGSWLLFSILGALTRTRPVTTFRTPLGNPEIIDAIVDAVRGPKKLSEEEKEKVQKINLKIEQFEKQLVSVRHTREDKSSEDYHTNMMFGRDRSSEIRRIEEAIALLKIRRSSIVER